MALLEVCIDSLESALIAEQAGADRLELCGNLKEGGTSPSPMLLQQIKEKVNIPVMCMLRPRGGDFLYNISEWNLIKREQEHLHEFGADGFVVGALNSSGEIDRRVEQVVTNAEGKSVTFHRAFDLGKDYQRNLEQCIEMGFDRILTSGLANDVITGSQVLVDLVELAKQEIVIMPGGGIRTNNFAHLVSKVSTGEYHVSARRLLESGMEFQRQGVWMGKPDKDLNEYQRKIADIVQLREFRQILDQS